MELPRLIVAAPMSSSGKTTLTAGLVAALVARGLDVVPFKIGPDYIDPSYHALAAGRPCYNLDSWLLTPEQVATSFAHRAAGADLALIEGMMGLFDGFSGADDTGSTAHVARTLDAPVLLTLDVNAMVRSAAALVQGMRDFDRRVRVAGVVLNNAGGARHADWVREAIESQVGLPVVGYLATDTALRLQERHLGLIPTREPGRWRTWLDAVRRRVEETVDLDQVLALARAAPPLPLAGKPAFTAPECVQAARPALIAVARDEAFSFLYADNLDLLRAAGAEIVFFSPLRDRMLPDRTAALYLCGGFPELYAAELAANAGLRAAIGAAGRAGMPIYAECGGLMYLTEQITGTDGVAHAMVGLLAGQSAMTQRLTIGYRTVRAADDSWLLQAGETLRGHEFHSSIWERQQPEPAPAYEMLPDAFQAGPRAEGAKAGNLIASYVHLHFLAYPELAGRFVLAARHFGEQRR